MKWLRILSLLLMWAVSAGAEEFFENQDRDPAAILNPSPRKRAYPGGADEGDLVVQNRLPEAALKTDQRSLQRGVYKALFNHELKDERQETPEE